MVDDRGIEIKKIHDILLDCPMEESARWLASELLVDKEIRSIDGFEQEKSGFLDSVDYFIKAVTYKRCGSKKWQMI